MKLNITKRIIISCFLIFVLFDLSPASIEVDYKVSNLRNENNQTDLPKLLFRYAFGTSMATVGENLQLLRGANPIDHLGEIVGIRICSDKNLLSSIPLTTINPMQIADYLINIDGIKPSKIFLLSSKECRFPSKDYLYPVEIWRLEKDMVLPLNNENYNYEKIKYLSLGFDPIECPKIDNKKVSNELIKQMRNDKTSVSVIVSYYLRRPDFRLTKQVKVIEDLLKKNNISRKRYSVTKQSWHDGDSACANKEPTQPMIIFMTLNK